MTSKTRSPGLPSGTRKEAKRRAVVAWLQQAAQSLDTLSGLWDERQLDSLILAFGIGTVELREGCGPRSSSDSYSSRDLLDVEERRPMPVMQQVSADHPLMIAWKRYRATEDFANTKAWAMALYTSRQMGQPARPHPDTVADAPEDAIINPVTLEHRERFVMGSLWAAFMAGHQSREKLLAAALLWARNHIDCGDPTLKRQVVERLDGILNDYSPTSDDLKLLAAHYPLRRQQEET